MCCKVSCSAANCYVAKADLLDDAGGLHRSCSSEPKERTGDGMNSGRKDFTRR